jgi:hypothetical protein
VIGWECVAAGKETSKRAPDAPAGVLAKHTIMEKKMSVMGFQRTDRDGNCMGNVLLAPFISAGLWL